MTVDNDLRRRLLNAIWTDIRVHSRDNIHNYPAAERAIAAGASPDDLVRAMTAARYEMAFGMLYLLTGEGTELGNTEAATGWAVVKVAFEGDNTVVVGTEDFALLFEELLGADPAGLEGADFLS